MTRRVVVTTVAIAMVAAALAAARAPGLVAGVAPAGKADDAAVRSDPEGGALATFARQPLSFEPNVGQGEVGAAFVARGLGYEVSLGGTDTTIALQAANDGAQGAVRLSLDGANPAALLAGADPLPGTVNYVGGSDPRAWKTGVPTFAKVAVHDAYPGIDALYYGKGSELEYDFVVAPGADPGVIRMAVEGAAPLRLDAGGALLLDTPAGRLVQHRPVVYQDLDGTRRPVEGAYALDGPAKVSFRLGPYDHSRPLVIDPSYSTYLGGSLDDGGNGIAVDGSGNAYVTGYTRSFNFPVTNGSRAGGLETAFVTKFSPTGARLYSTYLGGNGADRGQGIAVDGAGNAYVTGSTQSPDFPVIPSGGGLNPVGGIVYSQLLGGTTRTGNGIDVDSAGNAYIVGNATDTGPGSEDVFVTKRDPAGTSAVYYVTEHGNDTDRGQAIAVDAIGRAYVTGFTNSDDFPMTFGSFDFTYHGMQDGFFLQLRPGEDNLRRTRVHRGRHRTARPWPLPPGAEKQSTRYRTEHHHDPLKRSSP